MYMYSNGKDAAPALHSASLRIGMGMGMAISHPYSPLVIAPFPPNRYLSSITASRAPWRSFLLFFD